MKNIYPQQMIFRLGGERSSNRSVYKIHDCCERREANNTENSAAKGIQGQNGFSIVEVLVALIISMILLAGVLQIFLNAKTIYGLANGYTVLQENGRFITEYATRVIRLSGYRSTPTTGNNFVTIENIFTSVQPYATGTFGTGVNNSDTLTVRFQGSGNGAGTADGTIRDCLNNAADSNTMVTNTFSVTNNYEFQCQAINPNSPTPNSTQTLISGVENFKVLFGEDLNNDSYADRYVPANYPFLNMARVVSVRMSLLLRSDEQVSTIKESSTYNLLGTSFTPPTDNFLRRQMTFTVLLRNLATRPN